jgi:hypothetical protein
VSVSTTTDVSDPSRSLRSRLGTQRSWAYFWLFLFITLFFFRPEDWIPGLALIPVEKITGALALLGFAVSVAGGVEQLRRMPTETLCSILLLGWLCLTIPFAVWRGGAFHVIFSVLAKVILIAIAISLSVNTLPQLRRLMLTQACAVPVLAAAALVRHRTEENGRLMGVGNGFDNANDFAFLIALTLPLCLAFLLSTRNLLVKAAWTAGIAIMGVALVLTASRQGLITAGVALTICLWEFGWKGRRLHLLLASLLLVLGILAVAGPGRMARRLESTFGHADPTAYLSTEIRGALLEESVLTALKHPLLGIGPGNFTVISGFWRAAHNSFTEMAAEGGFPALVLFLVMLALALRNVRKVKLRWAGRTEEILLAGALGASLVTFLVGGMFSSWEYQYLPYLMIAYSTALYRIASAENPPEPELAHLPQWRRAYRRPQGQRKVKTRSA